LGISPTGEIYPCNRLVGVSKYLYGSLAEIPLDLAWLKAEKINADLMERIRNFFELPCLDCDVKSFCGLGCKSEFIYGSFSFIKKDFYREFCMPFKKYLKTIKNIAEAIADEFEVSFPKA
jgi:radical SAM protein with 4Fe4S-binding SPASM domain